MLPYITVILQCELLQVNRKTIETWKQSLLIHGYVYIIVFYLFTLNVIIIIINNKNGYCSSTMFSIIRHGGGKEFLYFVSTQCQGWVGAMHFMRYTASLLVTSICPLKQSLKISVHIMSLTVCVIGIMWSAGYLFSGLLHFLHFNQHSIHSAISHSIWNTHTGGPGKRGQQNLSCQSIPPGHIELWLLVSLLLSSCALYIHYYIVFAFCNTYTKCHHVSLGNDWQHGLPHCLCSSLVFMMPSALPYISHLSSNCSISFHST